MYNVEGERRMSGAPVELDKRLGGVIGSLRERGEFAGDQLETLLITPPEGSVKAKALLLVGLGGENALSLKRMEAVGRVSLREAALPAVARESADWGPAGYGLMLGSLGAGAVCGTLLLPAVRRGRSADVVVAGGTVLFAACAAGVAFPPVLWVRCLLLFPAGAAWLAGLTTLSSSAQSLLPAWVRARSLSVYLLVFCGGLAAGSVLWGAVAGPLGVPLALLASAAWMAVALTAGLRYQLPAGPPPADEPSRHWPEAPAVPATEYERGPVLVTVEYRVPADRVADFRAARLRDGAIRWDLFQDVEDAERLVEVFLVESWVDHLRQHERVRAPSPVRIYIYGWCSCHQARARASVHSPAHAQPARASSRLPALGKRSAGALARQRRSAASRSAGAFASGGTGSWT
jgi:hypothetical protein